VLRVSLTDGLVRMEYWNADGSEAEMCGNGLRCVARFAFDRGMSPTPGFEVLTPVGRRRVEVKDDGWAVAELGPVRVGEDHHLEGLKFRAASVGNPHAVAFVDDPDAIDVAVVGTRVGTDLSRFPAGANVEFVRAVGPARIEMRVWERGVGETLACGTGIVAAAAVARADGAVDETVERVEVAVPGGEAIALLIDGSWWLEGPATYVFEGTWPG
jgi:diaminopimelate epimerase